MKKVGITGGIGSGKTFIANIFSKLGIPVFYADLEAKKIMNKEQSVISSIQEKFGQETYKNRILQKKVLADLVFIDKEKLKSLNSIVHPFVIHEFENWAKKQNSSYVIKESAILFESHSHKFLDYIICVKSSCNLCVDRILDRDGISIEE